MATLPSIAGLTSLDRDTLRAFRERLAEVGVTIPAVAEARAPFAGIHSALAAPLRCHYLRKRSDAAAHWMRLFVFGDKVPASEAETAVGALFGKLLEAGLLRREGDVVESPFELAMFNKLLIFCDRLQGEEGVMGFGSTTVALAAAAFPMKQVRTALDVGCGAGTLALVLAPAATRVVGVDIDPRAIELSKFNARLNEVTNVEFRVGDLLAPVAGEQFDLVVSQPPFLAAPDGAEPKLLTHGGRRGDELSLRLLAGLPKVLSRGGLAVMRIDWLVTAPAEGERAGAAGVEDRVRAHLGPDLDLTIVTPLPIGLDAYASLFASAIEPVLGDAYVAEFKQRRDHLEALGGQGILASMTLVHRSGASPGATLTRITETAAGPTQDSVLALLDARALARDDEKLLGAKLRVPKGTVFAEEQTGPGASVESQLRARFAPGALTTSIGIDARLLFIFTAVHEEPTVRAAIARYATEAETTEDDAKETLLPILRDAVLQGFLTTQDN